jgi:hypothetical protein
VLEAELGAGLRPGAPRGGRSRRVALQRCGTSGAVSELAVCLRRRDASAGEATWLRGSRRDPRRGAARRSRHGGRGERGRARVRPRDVCMTVL